MYSKLQLLSHGPEAKGLQRVARLATFLGIDAAFMSFEEAARGTNGSQPCVLDLDALAAEPASVQSSLVQHLLELSHPLLLLVSSVDVKALQLLETLSSRRIQSLNLLSNPTRLAFPAPSRSWTRELAGHEFPRDDSTAIAFGTAPKADLTELMLLDSQPSFLAWTDPAGPRLAWATPHIFDVSAAIGSEYELERRLDSVLPLLVFLRAVFRESCWHNPDATAALIIDFRCSSLTTASSTFADSSFPRGKTATTSASPSSRGTRNGPT